VAAADLPIMVAQSSIGERVEVTVLRKGREMALSMVVGELKEPEPAKAKIEQSQLGLVIQGIDTLVADNLGLKRTEGVLITAVQPGSMAEDAGLNRGDIVLEINQIPVTTVEDVQRTIADSKRICFF
jgi:serine protease Do